MLGSTQWVANEKQQTEVIVSNAEDSGKSSKGFCRIASSITVYLEILEMTTLQFPEQFLRKKKYFNFILKIFEEKTIGMEKGRIVWTISFTRDFERKRTRSILMTQWLDMLESNLKHKGVNNWKKIIENADLPKLVVSK